MKDGDIVYFSEPHTSLYVSGEYHYPMNVGFTVSNSTGSTLVITNPIDNTNHFLWSSDGGINKLITLQQYRENKLKRILNEN